MNNQVLIDRVFLQDLFFLIKQPRTKIDARAVLVFGIERALAKPTPIPDADHCEDVRTMVLPDGYRLVPIEPTAAQCFTAAFNLCNDFGDEFVRDNKQFALAAYRSLVAASPSAKESSQ